MNTWRPMQDKRVDDKRASPVATASSSASSFTAPTENVRDNFLTTLPALHSAGVKDPRHRSMAATRALNSLRTDDIKGARPQALPPTFPERRGSVETIVGAQPRSHYPPANSNLTREFNSLNTADIAGSQPLGRTARASMRHQHHRERGAVMSTGPEGGPGGGSPRSRQASPTRQPLPFASSKRDTALQRPINYIEYFDGL